MSNQLFTNVSIFDGSGKKPFAGEVLVQGNRIKKVARGKTKIRRNGAKVIDCGGATLLPGFVDCHAHLAYCDTATLFALGDIPTEENQFLAMHNAKLYMDIGITAAVSAASSKPRTDIVLRNEINSGRIPGPRLRAATPQFVTTGGPWDARQLHMDHGSFEIVADGPVEFRQKVREMVREGVDIVKLAISGDAFIEHTPEHAHSYSEDELAAACEVAHSRGLRLAAHCRADASIRAAIKHGITFIHHAEHATTRTLDLLEKNKNKHYVCPAIGIIYATLYEGSDWGVDHEYAVAHRFDKTLQIAAKTTKEMFKRGIKVMPYGDYGFAWNPQGTNNRDLEHFVNLIGFTPAQTLMMATKWGGEAWAGSDPVEMGEIKEGYLADMMVIDGDPIKDITLFQDTDNFLMIMKNGEYHKAPQRRRAGSRRQVVAAE